MISEAKSGPTSSNESVAWYRCECHSGQSGCRFRENDSIRKELFSELGVVSLIFLFDTKRETRHKFKYRVQWKRIGSHWILCTVVLFANFANFSCHSIVYTRIKKWKNLIKQNVFLSNKALSEIKLQNWMKKLLF